MNITRKSAEGAAQIHYEVERGGRRVKVVVPSSPSLCQDIYQAALDNPMRALAACVGLAIVGNGAPKVRYERCGYNAAAYGGRVTDALVQDGWTLPDIQQLGKLIFEHIEERLLELHPSDEEVDAAEGFSGGTEG